MKQQLSIRYVIFLLVGFFGCVVDRPSVDIVTEEQFLNQIKNGIRYLHSYDSGITADLIKSKTSFDIALDMRKLSPLPFDGLACVAIRQKDYALARFLLKKAIILEPNYSRAYVNLAYLEKEENNILESESLLKKSLEIYKFDPYALNNLGSLIFNNSSEKDKKNEAKNLFYKSKELYDGKSLVIDENLKIVEMD